jgi:hypothetical protein
MHRMVVRVCRRVRHRASVIVSIHVCSILYMVFVCETADIAKECESEAKQDTPWDTYSELDAQSGTSHENTFPLSSP